MFDLSSAGLVPPLVASLFPAVVTESDGVTTFTRHWTDLVIFAAAGLPFLAFGLLLFAGKVKGGKGKPRIAGALLALLGSAFVLAAALIIPFEHVSVGPERLEIAGGLLGKGISQTVDLSNVAALELTQERRSTSGSGRRRRSRGTRIVDVATFTTSSGRVEEVGMSGDLCGPALPLVIERVKQLGGKVVDRRNEFAG